MIVSANCAARTSSYAFPSTITCVIKSAADVFTVAMIMLNANGCAFGKPMMVAIGPVRAAMFVSSAAARHTCRRHAVAPHVGRQPSRRMLMEHEG